MPNYTFQDKETEEEFNITMSMSEHEEFIKNNPRLRQMVVYVPLFRGSKITIPDSFKERLHVISKAYPDNNMEIPG